jgi:hypothetical protein
MGEVGPFREEDVLLSMQLFHCRKVGLRCLSEGAPGRGIP